MDFAPIASQFFVDRVQYVDPNEHLAIAGPSTSTIQEGGSVLPNPDIVSVKKNKYKKNSLIQKLKKK